MSTNSHIIVGAAMLLVGASIMGAAYHNDYDKPENNANTWTTMLPTGLLAIICESQGPDDKVNPNPANETTPGIGGLCYASSQDFADCDFAATNMTCMYNKTAEKAKKPAQNDWGFIQPKCTNRTAGTMGGDCDPTESEGYLIRINSNTRSCDGTWGETFAYKESIAYWAGSAPNNETGASGHVTFFVNEPLAEGTYNRDKQENITGLPKIGMATLDATNCSGNGSSWGMIGAEIAKKT